MSEIISVIRAIVQDELKKLSLGDIGRVVKTYPHKDGDTCNYECDIKLRESEVVLEKVPMTTPHIGMVSPPKIDELVLIVYVNGDINRPVITGRLYSESQNPPEYEENEWKIFSNLKGKSSFSFDKEENIILKGGKTKITIKPDENIEIESPKDLYVKIDANVNIKCSDCKIDASGNIDIGTAGGGVITNLTHKCFMTGAPPIGSQTVKAKG